MAHFLITRTVEVEQVVLIEAETRTKAKRYGFSPESGEVQYSQPIDVTEIKEIEGP